MEQGIESVLATVSGTVFRSSTGEAVIFLDHDPYVISVNLDGDTASAYLVTVPPAVIAAAMNLGEGDVSGWSTGWDA
jgi:hypothetical protein